jgi:hypothetical protein
VPPLSEVIVPEIDEVVRTFSLVKVYERYEERAFGDGELILCAPGVSIRFVRERDIMFMDLRGDDGEWVRRKQSAKEVERLSQRQSHPFRFLNW